MPNAVAGIDIRALDPDEFRAVIPALAALTVDAVESGAGVNFLAGATTDQTAAWWSARPLRRLHRHRQMI